jgi:hypothetical protein
MKYFSSRIWNFYMQKLSAAAAKIPVLLKKTTKFCEINIFTYNIFFFLNLFFGISIFNT